MGAVPTLIGGMRMLLASRPYTERD
ncbi:uncharacterized protein METZ01_LOCUS515624 [marine metagenome]|uniref:Uncharacterized protein n=1 Tax=marine metagenome TaxID=408172 RepID=A0A383F2M0_9ZZZZ